MPFVDEAQVMELNREILDLWSRINETAIYLEDIDVSKDKNIDTIRAISGKTPYLYGTTYKENCVLLVSMNYSTAWEKNYDDKVGLIWKNDYNLEHPSIAKLVKHHSESIYSIPEERCSKIIPDIVFEHDDACHIDMFLMRHTYEKDLKPLLKKGNALTRFATEQLAIFQKMVGLIKPKIVVGIDAYVSEIIFQLINRKDEKPYYPKSECKIGNHYCHLVLGGMVFGARAMDRWSQARLKATITKLLFDGHYYAGETY